MPNKKRDPSIPKKKAGRKKAPIDWIKVNKMLNAGCEGTAIATQMGISNETLYRNVRERYNVDFGVYATYKKSEGRELLRMKQWEVAMKGDRTMLIWLGKNLLDQKDRSEMAVTQEEAKENFFLMIPHDGRSENALKKIGLLGAEEVEALTIPEEEIERIKAVDDEPHGLFTED